MERVKGRLIKEQVRIKKFEEKKQKLQNIKFSKSIKDFKNKEQSQYKRSTKEGVDNWKTHVASNPGDYNKLDDFLTTNKQKGNVFTRMKKNKKERKSEGRNGKFGKIDEDKWDFGHRDDEGAAGAGTRKERRNISNNKGSKFNKRSGGEEGGEEGGNKRGKGGKKEEKTRPGKVKRMMQRNKKKSFAGNQKKQ